MYCKKCGGKLESYASHCAFCGEPVEKYDTKANYVKEEREEETKHMTVLQWIGLPLLNAIPLIGSIIYLVLMFKWAFGSNKDITLKNYAKANLIMILIAFILAAVVIGLSLANIEILEELLSSLDNA